MNKSYLYILFNPLQKGKFSYQNLEFDFKPFYVGIGVNERCNVHFTKSSIKKDKNSRKIEIITDILSHGLKPIVKKICENISREEAKKQEILLVKAIGREIYGGILVNLTNGGDFTNANALGKDNIHSKKVYQYTLEGEFIKEWDCGLREVGRILNVSYNTIADCCRGKCSTAYNFQWFYEYKGEKVKEIVKRKRKIVKPVLVFDSNKNFINKFNSVKDCCNFYKVTKSEISISSLYGSCIKNLYFSYKNKLKKSKISKYTKYPVIIDNIEESLTYEEIAKKFNIPKMKVYDIKRGKSSYGKYQNGKFIF